MRDPARIERILTTLRLIWRQAPDLRLGQIISCASTPEMCLYSQGLFSVEDDRMLERLETFLKSIDHTGTKSVEDKDGKAKA